ncbi:MAG: DNA polymerase III subunit alpha [Hyphomicrobium sp.]|uniref:DNA polymerase III subunit alpha n=1 Tax=Hyphomicrobium sp. TaxID=82 RepID=UPI0013229023|nr:DNA polymerase III subunit alpha [Hyphomicrobium sp.]KAB2941099.1 MAG: DNA polymerase III subunit alpha [Hyphomicrobium sp.]MBZ0210995.1 DNA polymerase III subunit alpha [Hyphomicrobium sp.]
MNAPTRLPASGEPPAPVRARFVHLKVHSAYSLLEGALPIGKLAKLAAAHNFPALGLTDTNNLYGALEFSDKLADAGIQPIIGVTLTVDFADRRHDATERGTPVQRAPGDGNIALLAMNEAGYANLMKLVTRAHLDAADVEAAHTTPSVLAAHADGLIALTGGPDGPIDRALRDSQRGLAEARLDSLKTMFGDRLYVEMQRHGLKSEHDVEPQLLALAYAKHIPIVATNEAYFASPDDYEAHDALLCIAAGRYVVEDDRRRVTREHDFKSAEAMAEVFADLPEALDNTIEIAKRCAFRPKGRKPILPRFVAADKELSAEEVAKLEAEELRRQAEQGLTARLAASPPAEGFTREDYEKRLAYELDVIARMKFPGYFLIVADFIKWAKAQGVPVGPGRGSGAGSVVAWALTITDLDPLRFGLLFERFLNPERVSMPDFDIDFCQDRRDEVIRYVQGKYGHDRVAQIITHGKLQARAVLRDVGRVLQMPYGQVDRLCKLVPNNPANPVTLPEAIAGEPKLQEQIEADPMVARLVEIAQKLEGLYRHASTHAAGMVIGDRPLVELVPLTRDPKSNSPVTQFNWKLVEAAGLVKFDFLGLKTLTVLQKAVELVRRGRGVDIDLAKLPLDDRKSYELLAKADTVGVFQLESTGMRESLKRLKPDRFEDIIAMVALYRPGPMDNIPTYINRKHNEEPVDYLHPMLEGILKETYGVIIYQEQVIQIAQVMGGYTLGQADLLRRAMGKKDKVEMARHQAKFVEGAMARGVKKSEATYIFELVDKFAGYGFNKSHAAAYALVSYHTAFMKANYREEFLAASMTLDMSNTDKLAMFAAEAKRSGIAVEPPCVNASEVDFLAEPAREAGKAGAIRYSLAALKNIGASAVATIVEDRKEKGAFKSLADFSARLNPKALNKRGIETLAAAGALDALEPNRALVAANVDQILGRALERERDGIVGQHNLFMPFFPGVDAFPGDRGLDMRPTTPWTPMERLSHEFDAVGFYLSGHPLDQYEPALQKLGIKRYAEFEAMTERGSCTGALAGIVISARERKSQKGNKFAFGMFSDTTGQFEAVIFSDTLAAARDLLEPGTPVKLAVAAERDGDTVKMRIEGIESLDKAVASVQRGLKVVLDRRVIERNADALALIRSHLKAGGKGEVHLVLPLADRGREVEFVMPGRYDVSPGRAGILSTAPGVVEVSEL